MAERLFSVMVGLPEDVYACIFETAAAGHMSIDDVVTSAMRAAMADARQKILGDRPIDATGWAEAAFAPRMPGS